MKGGESGSVVARSGSITVVVTALLVQFHAMVDSRDTSTVLPALLGDGCLDDPPPRFRLPRPYAERFERSRQLETHDACVG